MLIASLIACKRSRHLRCVIWSAWSRSRCHADCLPNCMQVHHLERVVEEQASWVRRAIYWHQVMTADDG